MYGNCVSDPEMKGKIMKLAPLPKSLSLTDPSCFLATFGGVGLLRPAPGTFGSIAAFLFALIIFGATDALMTEAVLTVGVLVSFIAGIWASRKYETASGEKDNQSIVIDEACGLWLTILLVPWPYEFESLFLALILFRVFDIWKPWPIPLIEKKLSKGWDVMVDDVMAAFYAGIVMMVAYAFMFGGFHAV